MSSELRFENTGYITGLSEVRIAFGVCGAYHQLTKVEQMMKNLRQGGAIIHPVLSQTICQFDTKAGKSEYWTKALTDAAGKNPITDIVGAETFGPNDITDIMLIAPCTGTTLSRLGTGLSDNSVSLAAKAHLRTEKPVIILVSTNDGLSLNAENIAKLLNMPNVYFVPFGQDNPKLKPNSLVGHFEDIPATIEYALNREQIQPVLKNW